tara:strand:+ start:6081 stop:6701 length:621 start_codon:yes stop_codon:yes gene_type:complete
MTDKPQAHWNDVYATKKEAEVSWYQETPDPSLELLTLVKVQLNAAIIDIGGGASRLIDVLLAKGFKDVTVLDLSADALNVARKRIGQAGSKAKWIVADVTEWEPAVVYDVWHDRAAFHFLNSEQQQLAYIERLRDGLRIGGYAIIGTFALDGPEKCSGLPVTRHSAESLSSLLGTGFTLLDARRHEHTTPWGTMQNFQFSTFKKIS